MTLERTPRLFRRSRYGLPWRFSRANAAHFFFDPKTVMFPGPVDVDRTAAHGFKGSFHSDGADIDMRQHRGDEEHGDDRMDNLRDLHGINICAIERKHQKITAHCNSSAAENDDPVDRLLTRI